MMPRLNLTGGFYQSRSASVAAQRCLNLYPEPIPQQEQEPVQYVHLPTPGSAEFVTPQAGAVRCLYQSTQGDLIAVINDGVYVIHETGNFTRIGQIRGGTSQVRMQDNGITLFIVDGTPKGGWYCSLPSKPQYGLYGSLAQIADDAFYGSRTIAILDTFFLYTNPDTTNWYVGPAEFSDEATTPFDSTYVASKTSYPDTIVGIAAVGHPTTGFTRFQIALFNRTGKEEGTDATYNVEQIMLALNTAKRAETDAQSVLTQTAAAQTVATGSGSSTTITTAVVANSTAAAISLSVSVTRKAAFPMIAS